MLKTKKRLALDDESRAKGENADEIIYARIGRSIDKLVGARTYGILIENLHHGTRAWSAHANLS